MDFLGHRIPADTLEPPQDKLAAVRDLPSPTTTSSLRAALGLFSDYTKFVLQFNSVPLIALLKKDRPWEWGEAQEAAFLKLKEQLCNAAVDNSMSSMKYLILFQISAHTLSKHTSIGWVRNGLQF